MPPRTHLCEERLSHGRHASGRLFLCIFKLRRHCAPERAAMAEQQAREVASLSAFARGKREAKKEKEGRHGTPQTRKVGVTDRAGLSRTGETGPRCRNASPHTALHRWPAVPASPHHRRGSDLCGPWGCWRGLRGGERLLCLRACTPTRPPRARAGGSAAAELRGIQRQGARTGWDWEDGGWKARNSRVSAGPAGKCSESRLWSEL